MLSIWTDTDPEEDVIHSLSYHRCIFNPQPHPLFLTVHGQDKSVCGDSGKHCFYTQWALSLCTVCHSTTHTHIHTHHQLQALLSNWWGLWCLYLTLLQVSLVVPWLIFFRHKLVHPAGSEHQCVAVNAGSSKMRRSIKEIQITHDEAATSHFSRRLCRTLTIAEKQT